MGAEYLHVPHPHAKKLGRWRLCSPISAGEGVDGDGASPPPPLPNGAGEGYGAELPPY